MADPTKVFTISLRVTHAFKTRLEAASAEEGRSVSNLITNIVTDALNRKEAGKRPFDEAK